jgi:hypothetical protein
MADLAVFRGRECDGCCIKIQTYEDNRKDQENNDNFCFHDGPPFGQLIMLFVLK